MALKTTFVALIIAGLFAEPRAAAVKDLQDVTALFAPGFRLVENGGKMALSAPNGAINGISNLRGVTKLVRVPSADDAVNAVNAFTQVIKFPDLQFVYDAAKLVVGLVSKLGQLVAGLGDTQVKITFNATVNDAGECFLEITVDPPAVSVKLDTSGLNPVASAINGPPADTFATRMAGIFESALRSIGENAIDSFLGGPDSKMTKIDFCFAIINNKNDTMPSPVPDDCGDDDDDEDEDEE